MAHYRVWLFRPVAGRESEFAEAYAAGGAWASLFRKGRGFLQTQLLRPSEPGGWWLTIDSWSDEHAFNEFQSRFGEAYRALDEQLEGVAGEERFIGAFED